LRLLAPALPEFDLDSWGQRPYLGRLAEGHVMVTNLLALQPWGVA
jgi:hypothetical protein